MAIVKWSCKVWIHRSYSLRSACVFSLINIFDFVIWLIGLFVAFLGNYAVHLRLWSNIWITYLVSYTDALTSIVVNGVCLMTSLKFHLQEVVIGRHSLMEVMWWSCCSRLCLIHYLDTDSEQKKSGRGLLRYSYFKSNKGTESRWLSFIYLL